MLAFAGLVLGSGRWSPFQLPPAARALWGAAALAATIGAALLCAAIYPAAGRHKASELLSYHGHVSAHATVEALERVLYRQAAAPPLARLAAKSLDLSWLAHRKYRRIRLAMWSCAATAVLGATGVLLGAIGR